MLITCPHCHFEMRAKASRSGQFKASCLSCGRKLRIVIREAGPQEIIEGESSGLGLISGDDPQSTGSWAALPLGSDAEMPIRSQQEDPSSTLVWGLETLSPENLAFASPSTPTFDPIPLDEESASTSSWSVEALGSPDAPSLSESDDSISTDFWYQQGQGQGQDQQKPSSGGDHPRSS